MPILLIKEEKQDSCTKIPNSLSVLYMVIFIEGMLMRLPEKPPQSGPYI
jgi:hypothetical protein